MTRLRWAVHGWRWRYPVLGYWVWRVRRALGLHEHLYHWSEVRARLEDPTQPRAACYLCGKRPR